MAIGSYNPNKPITIMFTGNNTTTMETTFADSTILFDCVVHSANEVSFDVVGEVILTCDVCGRRFSFANYPLSDIPGWVRHIQSLLDNQDPNVLSLRKEILQKMEAMRSILRDSEDLMRVVDARIRKALPQM